MLLLSGYHNYTANKAAVCSLKCRLLQKGVSLSHVKRKFIVNTDQMLKAMLFRTEI